MFSQKAGSAAKLKLGAVRKPMPTLGMGRAKDLCHSYNRDVMQCRKLSWVQKSYRDSSNSSNSKSNRSGEHSDSPTF